MTENAQILTLRPGPEHAVSIETPMGLIHIERLTRDTRKIEVHLPPGLKAKMGERPRDTDGMFVKDEQPAYAMLVPVRDEKGRLVGAARPTAFELVEQENTHVGNESIHPMANG